MRSFSFLRPCFAFATLGLFSFACAGRELVTEGPDSPEPAAPIDFARPVEAPKVSDSPPLADAIHIYVAKDGSDANPGTSALPLATLQRANNLLVEKYGKDAAQLPLPVQIHVKEGRYVGQFVSWKFSHPTHIVKIAGEAGGSKPIFSGCDDGPAKCNNKQPWISAWIHEGRATNLVLENLTIARYFRAVNITGNDEDPAGWNGSNAIVNCAFFEIGSKYIATDEWSPAVITLRNTRNNRVVGNLFQNIANRRDHENRWLHTTYLSFWSQNNLIKDNHLVDDAADFHIRNGSNNNRFEGNLIERSFTTAIVTEWEDTGETSSCGTEIVNNVWRGNYYCDRYTAEFENNGKSSSCKKFSASGNKIGEVPKGCNR